MTGIFSLYWFDINLFKILKTFFFFSLVIGLCIERIFLFYLQMLNIFAKELLMFPNILLRDFSIIIVSLFDLIMILKFSLNS